jgi:hypothetical protein
VNRSRTFGFWHHGFCAGNKREKLKCERKERSNKSRKDERAEPLVGPVLTSRKLFVCPPTGTRNKIPLLFSTLYTAETIETLSLVSSYLKGQVTSQIQKYLGASTVYMTCIFRTGRELRQCRRSLQELERLITMSTVAQSRHLDVTAFLGT